ncbi:trehalose-phosphatase [Umbelopsis sp. PMI_123]|nr:trehalose-phosphatase [Umbelopsis sp. PMI_123]
MPTSPSYAATTPPLNLDKLADKYKRGRNRIIFFDYDGTLTPIRSLPGDAIPSEEMINYLQKLCEDRDNTLWIISGRDEAFLEHYLGHIPNLGLSAEHGCFIRDPGSPNWVNLAEQLDLVEWMAQVTKVFQKYTDITPGSFIERKKCALTWHYRQADEKLGPANAEECRRQLEMEIIPKFDVHVLVGKMNVEVRPSALNKGEIVKNLLSKHNQVDFIFCAGDDQTDEDMFRSLRNAEQIDQDATFSCLVGSNKSETLADYFVSSPTDIVNVLSVMHKATSK